MTTQQFKDMADRLPHGVTVDECSFYHGEFQHAYGHTPDMLIYWTRQGKGMTSRRDPSQQYLSMHDELFSGCYEYDADYDLERLTADGLPTQLQPQQKRQPQQLLLWDE